MVYLVLGSHGKCLKFSCNCSPSFFLDCLFQCWSSQINNPAIFFIFSVSRLFILFIYFFLSAFRKLFSFIFSISLLNVSFLIFNFQISFVVLSLVSVL